MTKSLRESSANIGALVAALAKAQGAFPEIPKDKTVRVKPRSGAQEYEFKYATLGNIIKAIKKPLSDNGIAYTQVLSFDNQDRLYYLETQIMFGPQWISSKVPLIIGSDSGNQQLGSALTYMRRYCLSAIVGVVADEDDDGNLADGNEVKAMADTVSRTAPKPPAPDPISTGIPVGQSLKPPETADELLALVGTNHVVKIDVTMLPDETASDWMSWGKTFMEHARACTKLELAELEKLNAVPLKNMELHAGKMFTNLNMALIKVRKSLEKT